MPTLSGMNKPIGCTIVPGGAAASELSPVSGINTADTLIEVRHISADLVTNASVLTEASIPDADTVSLTTTDTTGGFVIVLWQENE